MQVNTCIPGSFLVASASPISRVYTYAPAGDAPLG